MHHPGLGSSKTLSQTRCNGLDLSLNAKSCYTAVPAVASMAARPKRAAAQQAVSSPSSAEALSRLPPVHGCASMGC